MMATRVDQGFAHEGFRSKVGVVLGGEVFECGGVFLGEDDAFAGETVLETVLAGCGFAFCGSGAGGLCGVSSMDNVAKSLFVVETLISRESLWAGSARDRRPK